MNLNGSSSFDQRAYTTYITRKGWITAVSDYFGVYRVSFPGVEWPGHEVGSTPSPSAEV
jgi:hypothetical protein